jgi:diaminohydroxyphosphoribosylaminopyrimidine deaminase/5-amino-6-(5-phosphoribosylamino)uracil reductase
MNTGKDHAAMEMAYALAERAKGWASPNPHVGAVIIKRDAVIGYGYHEKPGKPHAEIIALERAGKEARGSTLYVTLEPCVHWGRTPPCIGPVLEARPQRIVISSLDPNPLVLRKGLRKIREAGIPVSVGILKERNDILNESYIKYIVRKIPFVTLKAAAGLDGRIAARTGDSRWISSPETREYIHLLRGEYDAIMTGVNTVIKDDPLLTVRHPNWRGKKMTRVILDSCLRFPPKARMLSTRSQGRILIFTRQGASPAKIEALTKEGAEVVAIPSAGPGLDLNAALIALGKREIAGLLVEAGGRLITSFLQAGLADKIFLTLSPKLIGGREAPSFFEGEGIRSIRDALRVRKTVHFTVGDDMILEGYF